MNHDDTCWDWFAPGHSICRSPDVEQRHVTKRYRRVASRTAVVASEAGPEPRCERVEHPVVEVPAGGAFRSGVAPRARTLERVAVQHAVQPRGERHETSIAPCGSLHTYELAVIGCRR